VTEYLFAVQDKTGREVCSIKTAGVDKVSTVTAEMRPGGVAIVQEGTGTLVLGDTSLTADELDFLRWDANNKLAQPVRKAVVDPASEADVSEG
jgi:hypothetical protein